MDPITAATLAWIAFVGALLAFAGILFRSLLQTRARVRAERVRSAFAEARAELVMAAIRGAISTDSATYWTLYFLNTAVMRRDDLYPQLWPTFLHALRQVNDPTHVNPLREESIRWTPDVLKVAEKTNSAIEMMLVEHSMMMRLLFGLSGGLLPYLQRRAHGGANRRIDALDARHEPALRDVRRFQEVLRGGAVA